MQTKLVGLGTNCQLNYRLKTSNFTDMSIVAEHWRHWIAEIFPAAYVLLYLKIICLSKGNIYFS